MLTEITLPTALRDRALKEINETVTRALPNLGEKERISHVEHMLRQHWALTLESYEHTIAPFARESEQRMLQQLDASGLEGRDREEAERGARRRLCESVRRMRSIHSSTMLVMLQLSGMEDTTANEILDACFFPPATA